MAPEDSAHIWSTYKLLKILQTFNAFQLPDSLPSPEVWAACWHSDLLKAELSELMPTMDECGRSEVALSPKASVDLTLSIVG